MEQSEKFVLPSPNFDGKKKEPVYQRPHYLTPSGMTLLPRDKQPPPMYGPRGATVPAQYLTKQQQKAPIDKAQPLVERQFCEACEMELQSEQDLRRHRMQHEPCPVEGCKFHGHASVMDKHVLAMHSTGLFEKVRNISTPEEIEAWRAERRKKYPTVVNVQLRQAAKEQRMRRGERLESNKSRFGKREDRKRNFQADKKNKEVEKPPSNNSTRNKNKRRRMQERRQRNREDPEKAKKLVSVVTEHNEEKSEEEIVAGVRMFKGTSKLRDYKHWPAKPTNALKGLLACYGSDDDEDEDDEDEKKKEDLKEVNDKCEKEEQEGVEIKEQVVESEKCVEQKIVKDEEQQEIQMHHCGSSDEAPEETPIQRVTTAPAALPKIPMPQPSNAARPEVAPNKRVKARFQRKTGLNYSRLRRQHTMLEKLLEPEIRHERNILLQCVRYVVANNFFGIGANVQSK